MSRRQSIQATFSRIREQIEEASAEGVEQRLNEIANFVTREDVSPVDTGAYVKSFSLVPAGRGGGRSRTSHNKPKTSPSQALSEARSQLAGDISALNIAEDIKNNRARYTLRNRAPHVDSVETGIGWARTQAYMVFAKVRAKFQ